jgi:hypothetical protein
MTRSTVKAHDWSKFIARVKALMFFFFAQGSLQPAVIAGFFRCNTCTDIATPLTVGGFG